MSQTRGYARIAAAAWTVVPVAWWITTGLEDRYEWEGLPVAVYQIGALALIGGGVVTLLLLARADVWRSPVGKAALVVGAVATLASVVSWALPLWMGPWALAAALAAVSVPGVRVPMILMSASMALGVAALAALSALEVGTPDTYGDYPVAGVASFTIATIGAAVALAVLSRTGTGQSDPVRSRAETLGVR